MSELKIFTLEELAEYDGAAGKPIYLLFRGKVYDITDSPLWEGGEHMDLHRAGHDLTPELGAAPHGEEVFERFPLVGVLAGVEGEAGREEQAPVTEEAPQPSRARAFCERIFAKIPLLRRHPHPMMVHFPIVFSLSAPAFAALYLLTGAKSLEITSLHCLAGALLFTPVAIATGLFTWWFNYHALTLRPVVMKLILSPLLLAFQAGAFAWRWLAPEILADLSRWPSLAYFALLCFLAPLASLVGWYGASLTFPLHEE